uniref:Uncharacterized protein n=1 Tax=Sander lucioperca TaxID=283035 RepID=A0A8D0CWK5_SANLU
MLWDLDGETVDVWTVIAVAVVLGKYKTFLFLNENTLISSLKSSFSDSSQNMSLILLHWACVFLPFPHVVLFNSCLYLHILLTVCLLCICRYSTPRQFPDDCVSVFDSEACQYIVHKKDDPSVLCPIYGAVGKGYMEG